MGVRVSCSGCGETIAAGNPDEWDQSEIDAKAQEHRRTAHPFADLPALIIFMVMGLVILDAAVRWLS